MLSDRYDPMNLFELVPKLRLEMDPVLAQLDRLLDDDTLFSRVRADLARRYPHTQTLGRHSTPVEVILRMLIVKRLYGFSYEQTEQFVSDSLVLRQFCRLYLEPAPDDTTLIRWANLIGPKTLEQLNDRVVELARSLKVTRGRKLRVDSFVVETNIHHPSDSSILGDGVRVLSRLLRRAKKVVGEGAELGKEAFRTRTRSTRRLAQQMHRLARRKGEEVTAQMKGAYERLIEVVKKTQAQAQRVCGVLRTQTQGSAKQLVAQFEHYLPLVEQALCQTVVRVIKEKAVASKEKILSLFEPHSQVVVRHKAGKPVEFGRKLWLNEVDGGIISSYALVDGGGTDAPYLAGSLEEHERLFGKAPWLLAGDRGVSSPENEKRAQEAGVKRVVLPCVGKAPPGRVEQERSGWFRRGFRFRAGIEGRISVLQRKYGLERCLDHGEDGMGRWVGWGIVTANLAKIGQTVAAR